MAKKAYWFNTLTGGGTALDGKDGDDYNDLDASFAVTAGPTPNAYAYIMDANGAGTESNPTRILPDTNPGTKAHVLAGWDMLGATIWAEPGATGAILNLHTAELTVVATNVLGQINFGAPLESGGTDAILDGASIWAVAEAEFTASVNSTSLVFATGASEAAVEKARLTSGGLFGINCTPTVLMEVRGDAAAPGALKLSTAELTTVDGDILGRIDFQAPLDSAGTDAIVIGASIWAEADDTFSASNNETEIVFATAASGAAVECLRLTSDGGATFAQWVWLEPGKILYLNSIEIYESSDDLFVDSTTSDKDIIFRVNDGGATGTEVFRVDGSESSVVFNTKSITGVNSITAATFTDSTISITGGNLTGATGVTATTITGTTLTDGTASITAGAVSGVTTLAASGNITTSAGRLGIGTASPGVSLHVSSASPVASIQHSNAAGDSATPLLYFGDSAAYTTLGYVGYPSGANSNLFIKNIADGDLLFYTKNILALTLDASQDAVFAGEVSGIQYLNLNNTTGGLALRVDTASTTDADPIANFVSNEGGANTTVAQVLVTGNMVNINNSYGAISARKNKIESSIVDATSKLADIMKLKIRNFSFKNLPEKKQIGVIADEIAEIFPGLVEDLPDFEDVYDNQWKPGETQTEDDRPCKSGATGTYTQSVKYSVLVPILIKAFQELTDMVYRKEKDFEKRLAKLEA